MSKWIRTGDQVIVIAGNDKGKTGTVLSRTGERVVVQGINVRKKHLRRTQETQGGRIVEMEVSLHISNVSLCTKEGTPFRVHVKAQADGSRDLVYRQAGKEVVYRPVKKPA